MSLGYFLFFLLIFFDICGMLSAMIWVLGCGFAEHNQVKLILFGLGPRILMAIVKASFVLDSNLPLSTQSWY